MALNLNQTATGTVTVVPPGAPLTNAVFTVSGGYSIVPAADGLSAVFTATSLGTGFTATYTADASDGSKLTASAALPDVIEIVATAVALTITTP